MPPSDFAKANLDEIVEKLTQEEAILLTAGVGFWHTHAVPRLGIPAIKTSDGPNGLRGNYFYMSTPAKCLPSSTAMGATFDTDLIHEAGAELLGADARTRQASIALAPTCNIQRNPLGGRAFESFSEDPWLSGIISAAYINGLQSRGIGATIKHFVTNDKENDRMAYDSVLSERALREVYLMPFMLAEKYSKPWAYMTAYNRMNGTHCSENKHVIQDILRKEWGSDATVMSDWFGVYSVDHAINAGLDLEMPGTNKWRSLDLMKRSIGSRKITLRAVKERARKVLQLVQRSCAGAPECVDGDGIERTTDSEEHARLMRRLAGESIVLLKNEGALLPLKPKEIKKVAIVGGNAKAAVLSGGGSAALKPSFFASPYEGIVKALGKDVEILYSEGATTYQQMPTLEYDLVTEKGEPGWTATFYCHESDASMKPVNEPHYTRVVDETRLFISIDAPKGLTKRWSMTLKGYLKPLEKDCTFEFGLCSAGRAKLFVNGKEVIDNWTRQTRGETFFSTGSTEEHGKIDLKAGQKHEVLVQYMNIRAPADGDEDEAVMDTNPGVRLGGAISTPEQELFDDAVAKAKEADMVIAVVGLNADWETEGYDRSTLALPGRSDDLVEACIKANPKTIVVTQSGSAITMPWADRVPAIVHAWYLGNATGDAIADVLVGNVNPAGRISVTFPKRLEDVPSHGYFNSENGVVRYGEDLFVGYKHYQFRDIAPQWAFGYGLSYTTFEFSDLQVSAATVEGKELKVTLKVTVKNTGSVAGSEVVQVYTSILSKADPALTHVPRQLRAFKKVKDLQPGESKTVELSLDKYSASYWEDRFSTWVVEKGEYKVTVGPSSDNLPLSGSFIVEKGFEWNGL